MPYPSSPKASNNQGHLKPGEVEQQQGLYREGLAPLPGKTGHKAASPNWRIKTPSPSCGQFTNTGCSGDYTLINALQRDFLMMALGMGMMFLIVSSAGTNLPMLAVFLFMMGPAIIGFGLWFFTSLKSDIDEAAHQMAPLLNPQKRQILFVYQETTQRKPQCPRIMGSHKQNALTFAAYFAFALGGGGAIIYGQEPLDPIPFWLNIGLLILGLVLSWYVIKPLWRHYQLVKTLKPKATAVAIPWEELAIEYQHSTSRGFYAATNFSSLNFYAVSPKKPGLLLTASLAVLDKQQAYELYEVIRQYMETGANGLEKSAVKDFKATGATGSLADYKQLLKNHWKDGIVYYLFIRAWYLVTLRYWAHLFLYTQENASNRLFKRQDIQDWMQPIPEEQWAQIMPAQTEQPAKIRLYLPRIRQPTQDNLQWTLEAAQLKEPTGVFSFLQTASPYPQATDWQPIKDLSELPIFYTPLDQACLLEIYLPESLANRPAESFRLALSVTPSDKKEHAYQYVWPNLEEEKTLPRYQQAIEGQTSTNTYRVNPQYQAWLEQLRQFEAALIPQLKPWNPDYALPFLA